MGNDLSKDEDKSSTNNGKPLLTITNTTTTGQITIYGESYALGSRKLGLVRCLSRL